MAGAATGGQSADWMQLPGLRGHVDAPPVHFNATSARVSARMRYPLVFVLFALVAFVFFQPWFAHLSSALIGPPEDNLQDFWNSWYAAAGHEPDSFFFTRKILFPEGTSLYYHSFSYPHVVAFAALTEIFGTDLPTLIAIQNSLLLLVFPIAGLGGFCLVRHFTGNDWASLAGGFVFAFNPSHVAQTMHHAHVASIEFLPFFVLAYLLAMEKKSIGWLFASMVLWALNALACWYYLFYAGFFVVFHAIYLRIRDDKLPWGWRLFAPLAAGAGTAILLSPLLVPMIGLSSHATAYREGTNTFVADLSAFFAFPPTHLLGGTTRDLYRHYTSNSWEGTAYLGLANLAVIAGYFAWTRRHKDPVLTYLLWGMLSFGILAMGECVHLFGKVYSYLRLPGILIPLVPFVANVRTPGRAIVLVYLFLAIGIGRALTMAWPYRHRTEIGLAMTAMVALIVIDFYPVGLEQTPLSCRAGMGVLRHDPARNFGILNLPDGYNDQNFYMAEQPCHGRPIAGGIVSRQLYPALIDELDGRDLKKQRAQLARGKIKYIVMNRAKNGLFVWDNESRSFARYRKAYPVVHEDNDMTILRVY